MKYWNGCGRIDTGGQNLESSCTSSSQFSSPSFSTLSSFWISSGRRDPIPDARKAWIDHSWPEWDQCKRHGTQDCISFIFLKAFTLKNPRKTVKRFLYSRHEACSTSDLDRVKLTFLVWVDSKKHVNLITVFISIFIGRVQLKTGLRWSIFFHIFLLFLWFLFMFDVKFFLCLPIQNLPPLYSLLVRYPTS